MASILSLTCRTAAGAPFPLSQLRGRPILVVNVASMCSFTAMNMGALAALHAAEPAVALLAFPCAQFARQEPRSACEVAEWVAAEHGAAGITVMEKIDVKGAKADPLFALLAGALGAPRWNYTKFLCDGDGRPVRRFDSATPADAILSDIARLPRGAAP
jgi:glutathione peroxidase